MSLSIRPLHPLFMAEVSGVDLTRPLDCATLQSVVEAMDRYAVCVYRATGLTDETHIAFSRRLGELELAPRLFGSALVRFKHPELFDAGNLDASGNILVDERRRVYNKGNALWHTDSSFNPHRSAYSLLLAHEIPPEGGATQFADMRAAYDALPESMRQRIEGLVVEHWLWYSRQLAGYPEPTEAERKAKPPARHPLVQVHPGSKRKTLYLASHASHVVGWPVADGRLLLLDLTAHATQPPFVYRHAWRVGDVVIWDNRCTMHRGRPHDEMQPRDLRRATTLDTGSTLHEAA